jgi:hypothetical protein
MHQGSGHATHMVGTPCGVGPGRCKHDLVLADCLTCGALALGQEPPAWTAWAGEHGPELWTLPEPVEAPEPVLDHQEPAKPGSGILVTFGRAEGIEAAQPYMAVLRRATSWEAKPDSRNPGMSGIGGCERKLAYRMAFGKAAGGPALRPWIGTQVHGDDACTMGLSGAFQEDNRLLVAALADSQAPVVQPGRWVLNRRVNVQGARGIIDLYDREEARLLDFKVPGITKVRAVTKGHVSDQYDTQLDLYALGLVEQGFPVRSVGLLVPPAAGELDDTAWYERAPDFENAHAKLRRRDRIAAMLEVARPLAVLEIAEIEADSCDYCPVLKAGLCPGVDVRVDKGLAQIGWQPGPSVATPPGVTP